ncbi:MAG: hypothetical protein MJE68_34200 [Proteobacteria bacterium]|nr:hypothetical protein [Pseudomonadota bacterium]
MIGIVQAAVEMFITVGIAVAESMIKFLRFLRTTSAGASSFTYRPLDSNLPIISKVTSMVVTVVVPKPAVGTSVSLTRIKEVGGTQRVISTLLYTSDFCFYLPLPELIITICVTA